MELSKPLLSSRSLSRIVVQRQERTRQDLFDLQTRTIENNFITNGPFLEFLDMHPMLDCGPDRPGTGRKYRDPFRKKSPPGDTQDIPADGASAAGYSVAHPLLLRQEFFGGIAFDRDSKHPHYLNKEGFALLQLVAEAPGTVTRAQDASTNELIDHLLQANLIHSGKAAGSRFIPAPSLNINYLQAPLLVEVELTLGCFRSCRHCAYGSSPSSDRGGELNADQWAVVFQQLAKLGVCIVQFTGGDPFFRHDAMDIMRAADDAGLAIYPRSDTAAINDKQLEALTSLENLWIVGTSCDGADAMSHDWMRGDGAFKLFAERARALADAEVPFVVGATLHKGNFRSTQAMGELATSLGASYFDIGFLAPVGRAISMSEYICDGPEIAESLDAYLEGLRQQQYRPFQSHYEIRLHSGLNFSDMQGVLPNIPYMTEWPFSRMRINPLGNVYTAGKVRGSVLSRGYNVTKDDLREVWMESPNLTFLRGAADGCRIHTLDYRTIGEDIHV